MSEIMEEVVEVCDCGKCEECRTTELSLVEGECTCVYEEVTKQDEEGNEYTERVLVTQCDYHNTIDTINLKYDNYRLMGKANINQDLWDECSVVDGIIYTKFDDSLDDLKLQMIKDSKLQLELWLQNNPLFSTVHNTQGDYYTITDDKQSLLARNLLLAQLSQSSTTTWNSTSNVCEEWTIIELSQLALEIEAYVRPRITKQQHYEVEIKACKTREELDVITFNYEVI